MAKKNILDAIRENFHGLGLSRMQIMQAVMDEVTKKAKVAPIKVEKGMNLKGLRIPMGIEDLGYGIGSEDLRRKISMDPGMYDAQYLKDLNERIANWENEYGFKRRNGFMEQDPVPDEIEDPNFDYHGGFDLDAAKRFASSSLSGVLPKDFDGSYKVVNASPDGRVKLSVVRPTEDGLYKGTVTMDDRGRVGNVWNGDVRSVAKPGSTGQWANIADKLYNVDFNSTVPVSFVRDRHISGHNFTDFNPNLKKYRNGFPVRELPEQGEYSRIGRIKRSTRRDLRHSGDPYSVPAGENTETPFMEGAKYKADMVRAQNAGLQFDNRLQQIRNEEDEIDRQIEVLKAKRDSIRDVYWGVRDLKDSVMNAAKIYNRR